MYRVRYLYKLNFNKKNQMKTKAGLITSLFLLIPLLFGFTLVFHQSVEKEISTTDTIQAPEKGTVYLYRVGRAMGAVIKTQIKINGRDAGGIGNNSYFEWELKPGVYTFSCYTKESNPIVEIDVKPGEKYYLRQDKRVGLTNEGRVTLKQVDETKGVKEMKKAKKNISSYK